MSGIIFLLIMLFLWMFIAPFIGISANGKANDLEQSLKKLQNRINELEQELKKTRSELVVKHKSIIRSQNAINCYDEHRNALLMEASNQQPITSVSVIENVAESQSVQSIEITQVPLVNEVVEQREPQDYSEDAYLAKTVDHYCLDDQSEESAAVAADDQQPLTTNTPSAIPVGDHNVETLSDVASQSLTTENVVAETFIGNDDNKLLTEIIESPIVDNKDDNRLDDGIDENLFNEISQEVQSSLENITPQTAPLAYSPLATARVSPPTKQISVGTSAPIAPEPSPIMTWLTKAIQWFGQGNVPVKVGMLILLFGVGALLKYAVAESWFTMTHALFSVGCAGIGAFVFAYTKRESHRVFSLTLQGGSIGVLLLTLFAASKIEHLISLELAFFFSFILIMATAVLSVRQNAVALAIFAIFSGFMAPIWLSSGSNNYVGLFSYYALLNVGIIVISWFKPWQKLNLLGFAFTFIVGITWGVLSYQPSNFATTEPFLLLFFALYLIIPIFYANRMKDQKERMVDAILVFGNPLLALSIQCYLLDYAKLPILWNALGLAVIYGGLAYAIRRLTTYRLLQVAYTALFWLFVMLAVPLAFAAQQTSIIYAFFAAMIFWWAEKTDDVYTKSIALIFHGLSIGAVLYGLVNGISLNESIPSFVSLAITAFFMTYHCIKNGNKVLEMILLFDALFFWLLMGAVRIEHLNWNIGFSSSFSLFLGVTALLFSSAYCVMAHMFGKQFIYRKIAFVILISGFVMPLSMVFGQNLVGINYLVGWNFASWYLLLAIFWGILWQQRQSQAPYILVSQLLFWLGGLIMLMFHGKWLADTVFVSSFERLEWRWIFISIPLLAMYAIRSFRKEWLIYPLRVNRYIDMPTVLATLVVALFVVWLKLLSLAGSTLLLPIWLPIVNGFDLIQLIIAAALIYYAWQHYAEKFIYVTAGFVIVMINVVIVRAIHHWFGYQWGMGSIATREFFLTCALIYPVLMVALVKFSDNGERKPFYYIALASQCMVVIAAWLLVIRYGFTGIDNWSFVLGGAVNSIALLFSAYILYQREEERFYRIFYITGIVWWFLAGFIGLHQKFFGLTLSSSLVLFSIATGGVASYLHKKSSQLMRELIITACVSILVGVLYLLVIVGESHPLGEGRIIVWLIYTVMSYWILHNLRKTHVIEVEVSHVVLLALNLLMMMLELDYLFSLVSMSMSVRVLAVTLPLTAVLLIALAHWTYLLFPLDANRLMPKAIVQRCLIAITGMSMIYAQLLSGEKMWGVWIPIVNSIELLSYVYMALIIKFAAGLGWSDKKYQIITISSLCALISMSVVRACYHFVSLPDWNMFILRNETVQMALTIVWTMLGFGLWIYGSKKRNQLIWRLGALLMGLVLLKLIVIDRTNLGNVMGIISFIGYGLFCLVIGYLAPQPPKDVAEKVAE